MAEETAAIEDNIVRLKDKEYREGVGRRKSAVARVRLFNAESDTIEVLVNSRDYKEYFSIASLRRVVDAPLRKLRVPPHYKISVLVKGGGPKGQAEAARLGLAKALSMLSDEWRLKMKKAGYLTRDARVVERKKPGLKKARKAPQWSKR